MSLTALRKQHDISQLKVAQALNVKQATVSQYENGKREPSVDSIKKLKFLFDCSYEEIIESILESKKETIENGR